MSQEKLFHLRVTTNAGRGHELWLDRGGLTAGRSSDADLKIDGVGVAAQHAKFQQNEAGEWEVLALPGAALSVEGRRARNIVLGDGDQICFGRDTFVAAQLRPSAECPHLGDEQARRKRKDWLTTLGLAVVFAGLGVFVAVDSDGGVAPAQLTGSAWDNFGDLSALTHTLERCVETARSRAMRPVWTESANFFAALEQDQTLLPLAQSLHDVLFEAHLLETDGRHSAAAERLGAVERLLPQHDCPIVDRALADIARLSPDS